MIRALAGNKHSNLLIFNTNYTWMSWNNASFTQELHIIFMDSIGLCSETYCSLGFQKVRFNLIT
jgi:hypothetical protein